MIREHSDPGTAKEPADEVSSAFTVDSLSPKGDDEGLEDPGLDADEVTEGKETDGNVPVDNLE